MPASTSRWSGEIPPQIRSYRLSPASHQRCRDKLRESTAVAVLSKWAHTYAAETQMLTAHEALEVALAGLVAASYDIQRYSHVTYNPLGLFVAIHSDGVEGDISVMGMAAIPLTNWQQYEDRLERWHRRVVVAANENLAAWHLPYAFSGPE